MAICDYCEKEFEDGDKCINGVDFCCNECMEDMCEVCLNLISPATSEAYMGRCCNCKDEEFDE